ncbi:NRAMP-like transporter smf-3 [Zalaria obscura]|uniref:NRAMP-like transporter smf-3 n=1 Tax=Zalaria obscura TaxID=2024903 RepID=A0ACC3SHR7_9PEZI
MNRPSRTDEELNPGWNQSPPHLSADLTTNSDLNGIINSRKLRHHRIDPGDTERLELQLIDQSSAAEDGKSIGSHEREHVSEEQEKTSIPGQGDGADSLSTTPRDSGRRPGKAMRVLGRTREILVKYAKFIGPGFLVSVAYIDPGNYATDVAAGASYRFRLLFMILVSNIFAIFLQTLCIRLGSITGMNLAEMCKAHLPPWLNYVLYFFAEAAIIATDIAEVIGTAISLNLLLHIPLVAGCAISIVDVLVILFFYRPNGSMKGLRWFECFVMLLVLGVVICFCFQLSLIKNTSVGEVFRGYLPSSAIVQSEGLYQSCGILGATVMPHSLYLGSGIIQSRLKDFDEQNNNIHDQEGDDDVEVKYRPSISAIRSCMNYSIVELAISLFTFALFVNSAILIVAGASLVDTGAASADLFGIHDLLSKTLAPAAGTIFALALLLSGTSAGVVCTIAGQMVSEGQLSWSVKPWVRRLMTRSISITPSIIIAGAVGRDGLSAALEGSQVALSVILPFVSAPLIYFTCRNKFMTVATRELDGSVGGVKMRNHWVTAVFAVLIWLIVVVMNVALLVLLGLGVGG